MGLRITTWNANSIRLREGALRRIVAEIRPDVLCLQEIKVENERFPAELCRDLGFDHLHVHGQKAYHGVAVLSKLPLDQCHSRHWCGIEHSRHAICTLPGGIELQQGRMQLQVAPSELAVLSLSWQLLEQDSSLRCSPRR